MVNHIEATPLVNTWMNSQRQFWDLWLDGLSPFIEAENNLLRIQGSKELEDSLRKLTNTTLDSQEKILVECCEHFSKVANLDSNTTNSDIFKLWKKEVKSIGDLEKKSFLGLEPLFNLYNPQKVLERMEELTSVMNKNAEAMEQHVARTGPEQTTDSTKPLGKGKIKHKRHVSDTH